MQYGLKVVYTEDDKFFANMRQWTITYEEIFRFTTPRSNDFFAKSE